jgi:hypothetical protein
MFGRFAVIWGLLTAAIAAVVGAIAYNAGLSANIAAHGGTGAPYYPYYGGWGFGWVFPLLFFILLFGLLFRGRRWSGGHGGPRPWDQRLDDWHKQQHGETPGQGPSAS